MKLLVVAVALLAGCSINHRSDDFTTCERQTDCPGNLVCSNGLCVDPNANDAPRPPDAVKPDAPPACPAQCTSCRLDGEVKECRIDCAVSAATCNNPIKCPPGFRCDVRCTVQNSCRAGIDCTAGESCTINCSGGGSCRGISCGLGPCRTICSGVASCRDIACNESCRCDVDCQNAADCENVTCTLPQCDTFNNGCSSLFPGCNTCQ